MGRMGIINHRMIFDCAAWDGVMWIAWAFWSDCLHLNAFKFGRYFVLRFCTNISKHCIKRLIKHKEFNKTPPKSCSGVLLHMLIGDNL